MRPSSMYMTFVIPCGQEGLTVQLSSTLVCFSPGSGLLESHSVVRYLTPMPHVTEHALQGPQSETMKKIKKKKIIQNHNHFSN